MQKGMYALLVTTAIFGVFGVWSAFNPSYFTIKKFGVSDEDMELVKTGMLLALVAIVLTVMVAYYASKEAG